MGVASDLLAASCEVAPLDVLSLEVAFLDVMRRRQGATMVRGTSRQMLQGAFPEQVPAHMQGVCCPMSRRPRCQQVLDEDGKRTCQVHQVQLGCAEVRMHMPCGGRHFLVPAKCLRQNSKVDHALPSLSGGRDAEEGRVQLNPSARRDCNCMFVACGSVHVGLFEFDSVLCLYCSHMRISSFVCPSPVVLSMGGRLNSTLLH